MTQKQKCMQYCMEHLQCRNLSHYYNTDHFNHIYRKFNGAQGNAFSIGIDAADFMIVNAKTPTNDTGNEN